MAKIKPERVPSDDCTVTVDGVEYAIHEGEWVEFMPGLTAGEIEMMKQARIIATRFAAIEGDADAEDTQLDIVGDRIDEAWAFITDRITGWNWTDNDGKPYPQIKDDPDVFKSLHLQEIYYLVSIGMGEGKAAEKNG